MPDDGFRTRGEIEDAGIPVGSREFRIVRALPKVDARLDGPSVLFPIPAPTAGVMVTASGGRGDAGDRIFETK